MRTGSAFRLRRPASAMPVFVVLAGCASHQNGHVSGPSPGGGASITLSDVLNHHGPVAATLETGEHCTGAFNTVAARVTWDDEHPFWIVSEDSSVGMLVFSCPSGYALRCNFTIETRGPGYGECDDGRGGRYVLVL